MEAHADQHMLKEFSWFSLNIHTQFHQMSERYSNMYFYVNSLHRNHVRSRDQLHDILMKLQPLYPFVIGRGCN